RQQQLLQYHRARRSQSYDRLSAANLGCLQTVAKKLTKVFRIYSQVPWWLRACYNKSLVQVRRKDISKRAAAVSTNQDSRTEKVGAPGAVPFVDGHAQASPF